MNNSFVFMAIGKAVESSNGGEAIKRYVGVGSTKVLAVNPNKEQLEKIYERSLDNAPEYKGVSSKDPSIKNVRIDFITKLDSTEINLISKLSFYLENQPNYNKDKSKVQVIDKYGSSAWVPVDDVKDHKIPTYSNGPARIDPDYRPALVGEVALTEFLKRHLNIKNVYDYKNGVWIMRTEDLADYQCRLDNPKVLFDGNFKEIQDWIKLMPENTTKMCYGVKTTDEGKQYQSILNEMFLYNGTTDYSELAAYLNKRKAAGAFSTTVFEAVDIHEYAVVSTDLSAPAATTGSEDMPW